MSDLRPMKEPDEEEERLDRLVRDRLPGEIESGMLSGSEDDISATDRFEGELTPQEAVRVLEGKPVEHRG